MKRYELRITQQGNGGVMIPDETGGWVMYRSVKELETLVAQQAAVIEQMRQYFELIKHRFCGWHTVAEEALTLQPCPEVLNKVRADAVAKFAKHVDDYEVDKVAAVYIQRMERGEA